LDDLGECLLRAYQTPQQPIAGGNCGATLRNQGWIAEPAGQSLPEMVSGEGIEPSTT
jgi:hypothetical protein